MLIGTQKRIATCQNAKYCVFVVPCIMTWTEILHSL